MDYNVILALKIMNWVTRDNRPPGHYPYLDSFGNKVVLYRSSDIPVDWDPLTNDLDALEVLRKMNQGSYLATLSQSVPTNDPTVIDWTCQLNLRNSLTTFPPGIDRSMAKSISIAVLLAIGKTLS